jgi:hypothetical protein
MQHNKNSRGKPERQKPGRRLAKIVHTNSQGKRKIQKSLKKQCYLHAMPRRKTTCRHLPASLNLPLSAIVQPYLLVYFDSTSS